MFRKCIFVLAMQAAFGVHATCTNPLYSITSATHLAIGENGKGCWATWPNDERTGACLVVAVKSKCNSATARKLLADWLADRSSKLIGAGSSPFTDPALKAVWEPDKTAVAAMQAIHAANAAARQPQK